MASKFHGVFEVSKDFVSSYVYDDPNSGDWYVVGKRANGGFVAVYMDDESRATAFDSLRFCLQTDRDLGNSYDYEIWHVVDTPDWMPDVPEPLEVLSIELVEHKARGNFDETLIMVKAWGIPRSGLLVLVTDWGFYTVKDWQGEQPISLRDMASNYECIEVTAADGLPTKEIDSFIEFCGMTANLGYDWDRMRGLKLSRGMLS